MFFSGNMVRLPRNSCGALLAFFWFAGLISGIFFVQSAGASFLAPMHGIFFSNMSIFALLNSLILPLIFSVCAVICGQSIFLLPIAFGKAFLFSFLSFGISRVWNSYGWLISHLLLFSDYLCMPILYCFWLRHLFKCRRADIYEIVCLICVDFDRKHLLQHHSAFPGAFDNTPERVNR